MSENFNVVLIAGRGGTAYAVLRALHAMPARVHLICDCRSSIRLSRLGKPLYVSRDLTAEPVSHVLEIINSRHARKPVDLVVASDIEGAILLNTIQAELIPPVFPTASTATLRLLDNKWSFYRLCTALGLPAPDSIFFASKERIDTARIESELGYPVVVKPVDMEGSDGVVIADTPDAILGRVKCNGRYGYGSTGLIVQRYVEGQDWGYSAFAVDGRVDFAITFACGARWRTEFRRRPDLLEAASRIIEHVRYTGVVNFDFRLDDKTQTFNFLECNPRFFRRVTAARLCGANFVKAGLSGGTAPLDDVCWMPLRDVFSSHGARSIVQGRWPISALATDVLETLSDPIPACMHSAGWARVGLRAMSPLLQRVVGSNLYRRQRNV